MDEPDNDGGGAAPPHRHTPMAPLRRRRGRSNWQSGKAAEDAVARHYESRGGVVRASRLRTPAGEIDLVVELDRLTVFVEVKRRAVDLDPPIGARQWRRLESAALHYMVHLHKETGVQPECRFDVALVGPDGRLRIIENARSFDAE